jgi:small subunit ribosomal protein S6
MLMREYETLYIVRPDLADENIAQLNERLTGVLAREGAKILRLDVWGKKKLAFEVKKNPKGIYFHLKYLGPPHVVTEFERNLRMIEPVIRYQTIKIAENVDVDKRIREQEAEDKARAASEEKRHKEADAQTPVQSTADEGPAKSWDAGSVAETDEEEGAPELTGEGAEDWEDEQ